MGFVAKRLLGLGLAVVLLAADQLSKLWAMGALLGERLSVLENFLALTLHFNRGVAFSLMADVPHALLPHFLAVFALLVSGVFIVYMPTGSRLFQAGLGCIVGGALGNMVDRVVFGGVIDFIHFYHGNWSFPVFNVADVAINIGVGLVLLDALCQMMQTKKRKST